MPRWYKRHCNLRYSAAQGTPYEARTLRFGVRPDMDLHSVRLARSWAENAEPEVLRHRVTTPISPKPTSIITHVAGSGTAGATFNSVDDIGIAGTSVAVNGTGAAPPKPGPAANPPDAGLPPEAMVGDGNAGVAKGAKAIGTSG